MDISPLAGKPAPKEMLVDLSRLEREYFERRPNLDDPTQRVSFGTSGHRGSPFRGSFTEAHILAITQAICDYRVAHATDGPLYMGKDTHGLSGPAQCTALEVLAANDVLTIIQQACGVTPTPVISRAILVHNRSRTEHLADGIVITPSHNPPEDAAAALLRLGRRTSGPPPAADPGGRCRFPHPQSARRSPRRRTILNRPDHPDAQIARIGPRHAVPQQHLWPHSRPNHQIWESPQTKISNLPSWKPL